MDNSDLPESRRTLYRLGDEKTTFTCPLKTISSSFVQHSIELFAFYEKGITPNTALKEETALYRKVMSLLSQYKDEAASWYQKELDSRDKTKRGGKR